MWGMDMNRFIKRLPCVGLMAYCSFPNIYVLSKFMQSCFMPITLIFMVLKYMWSKDYLVM